MSSPVWGPEFFNDRVAGALAGDEQAWRDLCSALTRVGWKVIRNCGLRNEQANDAMAGALFRLARHLRSVRDPERLPGWFATTTRRECLNVIRGDAKYIADSPTIDRLERAAVDLTDERAEDREALAIIYEALGTLPLSCQRLLRLLTAVPQVAYVDVAEQLGIPIGSIGPTRQRCLDRLKVHPNVARLLGERGMP